MPTIRFGAGVPSGLPVRAQVRLAIYREKLGYDTLWFPDHMLYPDLSPAPDAFTIMAAVAARTSRILLGTAVSDPHRVHPAVLAQKLATLDQLSQGRVLLGLGTGEAMNLEPYGIPWERKVARLREAVTILRALLDSSEPFSFQGDFYTLKNARICIRPYQDRRIPIYLAALGPRMQKLCGQVADGWYPVIMPPRFYREYYSGVAQAARDAGRDPESLDRVANLALAIGEVTREDLDKMARPYAQTLVWPVVLERLGIPYDPPAHLRDLNYITVNPCEDEDRRRYGELQEWMPVEMLEQFVHIGSLEQMMETFQAYIDQGVTHFSLNNASPDPFGTTAQLCARAFPPFTGRSATLTARLAAAILPLASKLGLLPKVTVPGARAS